eukprot:Nk52_evm11s2630 gene=Nk52_evmTU11s2630
MGYNHAGSGEEKFVSYFDVVDLDDEGFKTYVSDNLAGRFVESSFFRGFILLIIIGNSLIIGLQTDKDLEKENRRTFQAIDSLFLAIFIMEIVLKWFHSFTMFWKDGWNIFDFLIVLASLLSSFLNIFSQGGVLRVLRVLRAFRALRSVSSMQGLQLIVATILKSMADLINIMALIMILIFIFGVVGVSLFREKSSDFKTLPDAMFSLYVVLTLDGWIDIFTVLKDNGQFEIAAVYFMLYIFIGSFIFINILVGVVVTNLELAYKEQQRIVERENRILKQAIEKTTEEWKFCKLPFHAIQETARSQTPYEVHTHPDITLERVQNYFLLLFAIENNLSEFSNLLNSLQEIKDRTSKIAEKKEQPKDDEDVISFEGRLSNMTEGDVLSKLINSATTEQSEDNVRRLGWRAESMSIFIPHRQSKQLN